MGAVAMRLADEIEALFEEALRELDRLALLELERKREADSTNPDGALIARPVCDPLHRQG